MFVYLSRTGWRKFKWCGQISTDNLFNFTNLFRQKSVLNLEFIDEVPNPKLLIPENRTLNYSIPVNPG
jgi:hypothetical protein